MVQSRRSTVGSGQVGALVICVCPLFDHHVLYLTINIYVLIGLGWTLIIIAGAALGWYGPVASVLLHNLGTLVVMVNAGRLLRFDETGR